MPVRFFFFLPQSHTVQGRFLTILKSLLKSVFPLLYYLYLIAFSGEMFYLTPRIQTSSLLLSEILLRQSCYISSHCEGQKYKESQLLHLWRGNGFWGGQGESFRIESSLSDASRKKGDTNPGGEYFQLWVSERMAWGRTTGGSQARGERGAGARACF